MVYLLIGADILMVGIFALLSNRLPSQIPLFYSQPWGEDQLGELWMIFILPAAMNLFYFINRTVYRKFFGGNEFVRKILYYVNLFIIISLTFTFLKIIFSVS